MLTILHSELSLSLLSLFAHRGLQQIQFSSNEIQLMGQHCRMLKINTTPSTIAKNNCYEKRLDYSKSVCKINTTTAKNNCKEKRLNFPKSVGKINTTTPSTTSKNNCNENNDFL